MTEVIGFKGLAKVMQVTVAKNLADAPENLESLKTGLMEQAKRRGAALPEDMTQTIVMGRSLPKMQQSLRHDGDFPSTRT